MSADQTPGAPTEQEWAEALGVAIYLNDYTKRKVLANLRPLIAREREVAKAEALREAAEWIAEHVGYPVETKMPDAPMPDALWDALVTHVHEDRAGRWHGRELDRDEVDSWLCDEAGREAKQDGGDRG